MNTERQVRLSFMCNNCDELHVFEGPLSIMIGHSFRLMMNPNIGGISLLDSVAARIVDFDANEAARNVEFKLVKSIQEVLGK